MPFDVIDGMRRAFLYWEARMSVDCPRTWFDDTGTLASYKSSGAVTLILKLRPIL